MKIGNRFTAFTLIELMIGIILTVLLLTTFFRFFNHVTTAQQNNNYKTSALVQGAASLEAFSNATRLIGLTNTYSEFVDFDPRMIQKSLGTTTGGNNVEFIFNSVFGGPITKVLQEPTSCTLVIERTAANSTTPTNRLRIATKDDVYYAQFNWMNSDRVEINAAWTSAGAPISPIPCNLFSQGSLITGPNYFYRLTWNKNTNAPLRLERVLQPIPFSFVSSVFGAGTETLLDIPGDQVELVILQFLRLDPTTLAELWEDGRSYDADDYRDIKAVRIAVVLLPHTGKDMKGGDITGHALTICPFDDTGCVNIDDVSRPPTIFKKVIYLKNLDYLKRG